MNEETKKRCNNCGMYKTLDKFHRYVGGLCRSVDGYRAICIVCRREDERKRYHNKK